jgi:sialate O-acetylesterase
MKGVLTIFLAIFILQAKSQLHLSALFNDHMVLQRDKPVKIWGAAKAGDSVHVNIGNIKAGVRTGNNGMWQVTLPSFKAGGPYTITIHTGNESRVFSDVLFGEVWLCSGQSNMQFRVNQAINAKYEIHRSNNPWIRQVAVPNKTSFHPESFVDSIQWIISSPQTTGEFTAVGYFFARDIYEKLKVPVGLIYDNWGGSNVESWISKESMMGSDDLRDYAKQMSSSWQETDARIEKQFRDTLLKRNNGIMPDEREDNVLKSGYSFSGWMTTSAPGDLDWIGLPGYRGGVFMVREIIVDSIQAALPSVLSLGTNENQVSIFLNGKSLNPPSGKNILISLPPSSWKEGRNVLLVKIGDHVVTDDMTIGVHGSGDQVYVDFDGEKISLADDKWKMLPLLNQPHHLTHWMNYEGAIIYNAMIHPVIPFSIRGVLWYQGEANVDHANEYSRTFPLLIKSWRKEWNDEFPFLFVQLASFGSDESSNAGNKWPELREAQLKTLSLPKTGMAVTTDVGDAKDIHPKNKQVVGQRLAAIALNDVYGFPQTCSGPVYQGVAFSQGEAILSFTSTGKGLLAKNRYGQLIGFEIAGPDQKFFFADAKINGEKIIVKSDSVPNPVAVRYGWSNAPVDINLYNVDGYPASPFRTDQWPGVTDSARFFIKP